MNTVSRTLLVAAAVTTSLLTGPAPASACGGVDCTVRCVQDLVAHGYCRLG